MSTSTSTSTSAGAPGPASASASVEPGAAGLPSWAPRPPAHLAEPPPPPPIRREVHHRWRLPAAWPIWLAVAGFPVMWLMGTTPLVFPLISIPVAISLLRRGRIRVPPGFGIWVMFLIAVLLSATAMNETAPGTLPPSGTNRYFAFGMRFVNYVAMTLLMLYVGNHSRRELSQRSVMGAMAALGIQVIGLGLLAILLPNLTFKSPFASILPAGLVQTDAGGETGILRLSQVQDLLGYSSPRPAAPFVYTNAWGNSLSMLLVWFVVLYYVGGSKRARTFAVAFLGLALVPVIFSASTAGCGSACCSRRSTWCSGSPCAAGWCSSRRSPWGSG